MRAFCDLGHWTWKDLARRIWERFSKDNIAQQSAVLSFYFILSIFPLLMVLIAVLGLCFRFHLVPVVLQALHQYLGEIAPASASHLIDSTLQQIIRGSGGAKISMALVVALWAASQGMQGLIQGLNIAYEVPETRSWIRQRWLALELTAASAFLVGAALLIVMAGDLLAELLARQVGFGFWIVGLWHGLKLAALLGLLLVVFDMWYFYGPNVEHRKWHWLMPGTMVAMVIWLLVSFGFKLYLAFFNHYTLTYGSIGAVIILLWWLYLTGIAILLGAEVNSAVEKQ